MSRRIHDILAAILAAAAILTLLYMFHSMEAPGDTEAVASRVEKIVGKRLSKLDYLVKEPQKSIPQDMVIYRYCNDTLVTWSNQFPTMNDDISNKFMFQNLIAPSAEPRSPLAEISDSLSFCCIGTKWYLAKGFEKGSNWIIAALEIQNTQVEGTGYGINSKLRIPAGFSIKTLDENGGSTVCVDDVPQFKIMYDSTSAAASEGSVLVWLACLFFCAGVLSFLSGRRSITALLLSLLLLLSALSVLYFWGMTAPGGMKVFSPLVFADGRILYSIGAVVVINLGILLSIVCIYLVRKEIASHIHSRGGFVASVVLALFACISIVIYSHCALSSILMNSRITLELYKLESLSTFTPLVYVSFASLFASLLLIGRMVQPAVARLSGRHFDLSSKTFVWGYSLLVALYMVVLAAFLGLRRESDRVEAWAGRLAIDRDIVLELRLLSLDRQIAEDAVISTLALMKDSAPAIQSRVVDGYLSRITQEYSIYVMTGPDADVPMGPQIAPGSHFFYTGEESLSAQYTGVFLYYSENYGISRVVIRIEPRVYKVENGYSAIMNFDLPGKVVLPESYSYAKYSYQDLKSSAGHFAYPIVLDEKIEEGHITKDGFIHFVNQVSDGETIVISRPVTGFFNYLMALMALMLLNFLIFRLFSPRTKNRQDPLSETNYYRHRISLVLMLSLTITLVLIAAVSVVFVAKSNKVTVEGLMSDKMNSIQTLMEASVKGVDSPVELTSAEVMTAMDRVSTVCKADITIYSTDGKVLLTTAPMAFEFMSLGSRIEPEALRQIVVEHKRFFVMKSHYRSHVYFSMYAPLRSEDGRVLAIICSPYSDQKFDFEHDAVMHVITLLAVFILLLLIARLLSTTIVNGIFRPLVEMGRKMRRANLDSLEYIEYDRNDEISNLVSAYNRMVTELSESTRKLAQAERDKAWSGMARQVAHEIKNPLTPMKLQLQRIIRLKQKGDPSWQDKFDEVTATVLDHIDILTNTANEFSTFAKLYSEEPVVINLHQLLTEEITMFDNRDDISFEFLGLEGAFVMGPKPQLTRVFVNLINNAVQAVDARMADEQERGENRVAGKILVSLRKSGQDGYLDIVFEDNGQGVSDENIDKLFSPNFTTKSSGSGLGLAISRSILERCGASIRYSRSFSLGGACFTITYPEGK